MAGSKSVGSGALITLAFAIAVLALDVSFVFGAAVWLLLLVYHVVHVVRGFEARRLSRRFTEAEDAVLSEAQRLRNTGVVGLGVLAVLPLGLLGLGSMRASGEVQDAQRVTEKLLREPPEIVPAEWGAFEELEGSGWERPTVFWDIGGVSDNLLAWRTARYGNRRVPVVIEVVRYSDTDSLSLETATTLAGYVRAAFDLHDLRGHGPVLHAEISRPRDDS